MLLLPLYRCQHNASGDRLAFLWWGLLVIDQGQKLSAIEAQDGKVAVRLRSGKDLGAMPLETFTARIKSEAESRRDVAE